MSDIFNIINLISEFSAVSIFDRFEQTEEANTEQTEQTERSNPAFRIDLSQRAEQAAPQGRAALQRRFQLANVAPQATDRGEAAGGVITIPVGIERGNQPGGATALAAPAERTERPDFQGPELPTILANREPPRLDGVRMAASFEYTALGNALNENQNLANRPAATANTIAPAAVGPNRLTSNDNTPGIRNLGADTLLARANQQGPLARVENRLENPGNAISNNDQRTPLAASRLVQGGNVIGVTELGRPELAQPVNPGTPDNAGEAPRAGVGNRNLDRMTGQAELQGANATPGRTNPINQAGGGPAAPEMVPPPPGNAITGNELAGGAGEPADNLAGLALPENPLEPRQPALTVNNIAAPLENGNAPAVPQLADLQAPPEPAEPLNPPMPEPAPVETPAERAAAIRQTPAEAADNELRANVPAIAELAPGTEPPNAPTGPAENSPAAGPVGAPETAAAPRAGVPVETEAEEEAGAGLAPPRAAEEEPAGPARNENRAEEEPAPRPGEEAEEENQAQNRAIVAYEIQQMEARTNVPNERRNVTEMFVR